MEKKIDLAPFELSFMTNSYDNLEPIQDDTDMQSRNDSAFEMMEDSIPNTAYFLGSVDFEVDNWRSWVQKSNYYIISGTSNDGFKWALFRINWDDNWSSWNWEGLAKTNENSKNKLKMAYLMLNRFLNSRNIAINDHYAEILEKIEVEIENSQK